MDKTRLEAFIRLIGGPFIAAAVMAGLALAAPAHAEGFRCGQRIATPDMTVEQLLEACGEPTDKTVEVIDVYGPNAHGAGNIKRGTVKVETWTYDRGSQAFAMVVTIQDGTIRKMERAK
jgi:hypothetical protein